VDIVNIAQFSSRSSLMFVAKKSSGIENIEDMNGRKAGTWSGYELQPTAFFKKFHLNVQLIPIGSTNNLFLNNGVELTTANWFDEYHSIINSGYNPEELSTFFFADYGLNFLEDGIYCLDSLRVNDPELCRNFVLATAESWTYAFGNPEKAIDIVVATAQKVNYPVNRIHQRWMLDRYRDLYFSSGTTTTLLDKKDYMFAARVLLESSLIQQITPYENFYKHYTKNGLP
jgi:NitT/TauT family transport system substrate-binding protein